MTEILNLLFNPLPNGIMSILMGFSLVYWVFQLIAGDGIDLGTDSDIHIGDVNDVDTPDDIDANHHHEADADVHHEPSFWAKCLEFINVGKVPLMVIITLFKFIGWVITIVSTTLLGLGKMGIASVFILIPIFIIVYFIMHWVTKPLVKMYAELGYHGEEETDFIGRIGKTKSSIEGDKIGSGEFRINQDIITLNIKSQTGEKIDFGDTVIITDEATSHHYYYVIKQITLNNI
ncbi:OB-fold-containig protein [Algoriella sp.]|uniref:OB-fold-containig protein n=1 Tax=Algoriella sp. TaxID=1872434 RepID=UPI001B13C7D0|nr:OB-fold-containig protein [Algoriella sp.]MBO6213447.1 DUF1449 family protein [Algoriella sp.]